MGWEKFVWPLHKCDLPRTTGIKTLVLHNSANPGFAT